MREPFLFWYVLSEVFGLVLLLWLCCTAPDAPRDDDHS